jgi:hypothetical protein
MKVTWIINDRDYVNQRLQGYDHGRGTYFQRQIHSGGIVPSPISALNGMTDQPHTPAPLLRGGGGGEATDTH